MDYAGQTRYAIAQFTSKSPNRQPMYMTVVLSRRSRRRVLEVAFEMNPDEAEYTLRGLFVASASSVLRRRWLWTYDQGWLDGAERFFQANE